MLLNPYRFKQAKIAALADAADFKNVVLLLDFEGANGSTTVIDRSLHKLVPTGVDAGAVLSSAQRRFGNTSLYFPTGGGFNFRTLNDHQALNVGAENWTFEVSLFRVSNNWALGGNGHLDLLVWGQQGWAAGSFGIYIDLDGKLKTVRNPTGSPTTFGNSSAAVLPTQQWFDIAITRNDGVLTAYVNGVFYGTVVGDIGGNYTGITMGNGTGGFYMGGGTGANDAYYIDDYRITRGVVRDIKPRTLPFDTGFNPSAFVSHFEGLIGAQAFYEEMKNRPVTYSLAAPQVVLSKDMVRFGRAAALMTENGNTGWQIPKANAWQANFDGADFTLSAFVAQGSSTITANDSIASCWSDNPLSGWRMGYDASRYPYFTCVLTDGTVVGTAALKAIPTYFTWGMFTVSRQGSDLWLHHNGIPVGYAALPTGARIKDAVNPLSFGYEQGFTWNFGGYMDNLHFKKGVGDYASQWPAAAVYATPYGKSLSEDPYWNDVLFLWMGKSLSDLSSTAVNGAVTGYGANFVEDDTFQRWGTGMFRIKPGGYESFNKGATLNFNADNWLIEFDYVEGPNQANGNNCALCYRDAYQTAGWSIDAYPGIINWVSGQQLAGLGMAIPAKGVLYRIAFMRLGNYVMGFRDGKMVNSWSCTGMNLNASQTLYIGKLSYMAAVQDGWIGNVRITRHRARNYVPQKSYQVPNKPSGRKYARWDNYDKGVNATLSNGDLTYVGYNSARATVGLKKGKWYWEVSSAATATNGNPRFPVIGVGTTNAAISANPSYPGIDTESWGYYGAGYNESRTLYNNVATVFNASQWNDPSHVIGVALDMDNGTLEIFKNGVSLGIAFTGLQGKTLYPMISGDSSTLASSNATVNFGQSAFKHKVPLGFNSGVYDENIEDAVVYSDLAAGEYDVAFRLTGEGEYGAPIRHEKSRYAALNASGVGAYNSKQVIAGNTSAYFPATGTLAQFTGGIPWLQQNSWTWRGWVFEPVGGDEAILCRRPTGTSGWTWASWRFRALLNGTWNDSVLVWTRPSQGVWHHHQLVKDGTAMYAFVDGELVAAASNVNTLDDPGTVLTIGASSNDGEFRTEKYFRNLEFWPGIALNTASFTPPQVAFGDTTAPDPNFAKVVLLLHGDSTDGSTSIVDSSASAKTVTVVGDAKIKTAAARFGSGGFSFDGAGDYLQLAAHVDFQIFGGDFTLEFNAFFASTVGNHCMLQLGTGTTNRLNISILDGLLNVYGSAPGGNYISTAAPAINQWHHIGLVRLGSVMSLCVDGSFAGSYNGSAFPTGNLGVCIGSNRGQGSAEDFAGYIDEIRITKGLALYTTDFVSPTAPFGTSSPVDPSFAKVELLLHCDGTSGSKVVVDSSSRNIQGMAFTNQGQIATGPYKYGTGALLFPGGVLSVLNIPDSPAWAFGVQDFTLECYAFITTGGAGTYRTMIGQRVGATGSAQGWEMSVTGNQFYYWQDNVGYGNFNIAGYLDGWHHFAICRRAGKLWFFYDGKCIGSVTAPANHPDYAGFLQLGGIDQGGVSSNYLSGYLDEVRITVGEARYTGNFVPEALPALATPDTDFTKYGNLKLWLDGVDDTTITEVSGAISSWKCKVSGSLFSQATAGLQPVKNSGLMARQCVDFGINVNRWLQTNTPVRTRGLCTIFIVGYWGNTAAAYGIMTFSAAADATATNSAQFGSNSPFVGPWTSPPDPNGLQYSGAGAEGALYKNTLLTRNESYLAEFHLEQTASNSSIVVGGNPVANINTTVGRTREFFDWKFLGTADTLYKTNGAIGEILVYEGFLDAAACRDIRKALALKWKLK